MDWLEDDEAKVQQEDQTQEEEDNQVDWVADEEPVVQEEEEVGLAKAKVQDAVEEREDLREELLVSFVENGVESKVNMSDMYSKLV